jgi:hypothetical protein
MELTFGLFSGSGNPGSVAGSQDSSFGFGLDEQQGSRDRSTESSKAIRSCPLQILYPIKPPPFNNIKLIYIIGLYNKIVKIAREKMPEKRFFLQASWGRKTTGEVAQKLWQNPFILSP